ncbi:MAG: ammonium transporter [Actinobacteria bacterium]|jgi:Amt family ammonium transporter|nr:ammonium transporter [Actinomycetota bacterium]
MSVFADTADAVTILGQQISLLWIVIGAALVVFMQAGFALVETGFCRAKHAAHVVATNFAIFGLGFVGFYFVGFALAFGGFSYSAFGMDTPVGGALIGSGDWVFAWKGGWALAGDAMTPAVLGFFLYMVAFMDTVATIPTGSMAERWRWGSFVGWGFFCGSIYYPVIAAWTWGGGWLAKTWSTMSLGAGYVDFAGSGVVHMVGGVAALTGALAIGPRLGKFNADGSSNTIAGHHIPMAMLGTFILLFGWFGFNAASTFAATDVQFATAATNTAIAGAFGAVAAMLYITRKTGKPDPGMMANGMLAGLVAITAPCAFVSPWAAAVIGVVAAIIVIEAVYFFERRGIDDPVGAISVHGVGGLLGVLSVGIFANGSYGAGWNGSSVEGVKGLLYGDAGQLGAQALGGVTILVVNGALSAAFFAIQKKVLKKGLRSSAQDELDGLDIAEMGVLAYPEFQGSHR